MTASFAAALPAELRDSRPVRVLDASLNKGRLPHGILLHGSDLAGVRSVALALAGQLLGRPAAAVSNHPDCFELRPGKKSRVITVDETRDLIRTLSQTSREGGAKVAIIHEADRFRTEAANAFLKTLEEPPSGTYLLLLTTRAGDLLPTIRSRVFHFRLGGRSRGINDARWDAWLRDYDAWLSLLLNGIRNNDDSASAILGVYGLTSRLSALVETLGGEAWREEQSARERRNGDNDDGLDKDDLLALEAGVKRGLRSRLLHDLAVATRTLALRHALNTGRLPVKSYTHVALALREVTGLLELNLKEESAFEYFLLRSLKFWTMKG